MWRNGILLPVCFSLALIGCSFEDEDSPTGVIGTRGGISLRLRIDPASPFKSIAKSGTLTVSAADMSTLSAPLTLGDSTVSAEIAGIPAGKNRSIELKVFGDDGILGYQGSGLADILPDSTTQVAINLVRTTGSAVIVGRIIDDSASSGWLAPSSLTLGAQASATFGSVLDLESGQAWLAYQANANPGGIDLVCLYYGSGFHLDNAVAAREAGIANTINLTNSYDSAQLKEVRMVKVAARPADPESAKGIFAAGAKLRGSVVTGGEIFLVESTGGGIALLTVVKVVGSDNKGAVEVRLERSTAP